MKENYNFITVAVFQYPHEAYVIKTKLESEGIKVFLKDELSVQTYNFFSDETGGVKLQIRESDLELAIPILENAGIFFEPFSGYESKFYHRLKNGIINIPLFRKSPFVKKLIYLSILLIILIATISFVFSEFS